MVVLHNKESGNQGVTLPSIDTLGLPSPHFIVKPPRLAIPPLRSPNQEHQLAPLHSIPQSPASSPESFSGLEYHDVPEGRRPSTASVASSMPSHRSGCVILNTSGSPDFGQQPLGQESWEAKLPERGRTTQPRPRRELRKQPAEHSERGDPSPTTQSADSTVNNYIAHVNEHGLGKCGTRKGCPNRKTKNNGTTVSCDGDVLVTYCENCRKVTSRTNANKYKHQVDETQRRAEIASVLVSYERFLDDHEYDFRARAFVPLSKQNKRSSGLKYEKIDIMNALLEFAKEQDETIKELKAIIEEYGREMSHYRWLLGLSGPDEVRFGETETGELDGASDDRPRKLRRMTPTSSQPSQASSPRRSL